jgi:hypothetical protein
MMHHPPRMPPRLHASSSLSSRCSRRPPPAQDFPLERIGCRGLECGHPDEPALLAAATILGGGFTSRLLQAIRVDRSLTYEAYCESIQDGRTGLLRVVTFTKNEIPRETIDSRTRGDRTVPLRRADGGGARAHAELPRRIGRAGACRRRRISPRA